MKYISALILCCFPVFGQANLPERVAQDLNRFKSADWRERSEAFYDLAATGCPQCEGSQFPVTDGIENAMRPGAASREAIASALIALLDSEARFNREASVGGSLSEEYTDYNGDLVLVMAMLRDKRSVSPLFEFVSSGNMAQDTLAGLGDEALHQAHAILRAEPPGSIRRTATIRVIRKMAAPKNLQRFSIPDDSRRDIKAALIDGLSEVDYFARIEAVQGLAELGDSDIVPALEKIAASDEYFDRGPDGAVRFPVRREAAAAIKTLSSK